MITADNVGDVLNKMSEPYLYKILTGEIDVVNYYVSKEFINIARRFSVYAFMNFIEDPDRNGLNYGYTLKKQCIIDLNKFFEYDNA